MLNSRLKTLRGCFKNTSKSLWTDKIPARLLKDSKNVIAPCLTYIFNVSLTSGIFPEDWKKARISPIYKAGNNEDCGNYRPISALSTVPKISLFERAIQLLPLFWHQQIRSYLMWILVW